MTPGRPHSIVCAADAVAYAGGFENAETGGLEGAGGAAAGGCCWSCGWRCGAAGSLGPARRGWLARPGGVGPARPAGWGAAGQGDLALCRLHPRPRQPGVWRAVPGPGESLPHQRPCRPDPDPGLDRRLDLPGQRVRGPGPRQRRCRGRGRLRPHPPGPAGRQGGRAQLSRGLQRRRFAARLDQAQPGGRPAPGPLCPPGGGRAPRARGGGERGRRRDLAGGLCRGHHPGGSLCPGWGLHHRG
jgi:hypothetical protein